MASPSIHVPQTAVKEKKMMRVFKSRIMSCFFITDKGRSIPFIAGKYVTDNADEIAALEKEVALGHPHIYIDEAEREVDANALSPLEEIKRKAIEEYLAAQAAATAKDSNKGSSTQAKLKPTSSVDVSEVAAGSSSTS